MARIVLTTFGSFGDLHPYIAIGIGLKARGHAVTLATHDIFQKKVEAEGLGFRAVGPRVEGWEEDSALFRRAMDARKGPEFVIRELFLKDFRATYDDLREAAQGADLLLTHPVTFAGPIVAQQTGMRWASSALAPLSFFSRYEPAVLPPAPGLSKALHALGPMLYGRLLQLGRRISYPWGEAVRQLRAELGMGPGADPIFEGQHSPSLVLALFSEVLGQRQRDWPPNARITGFPFYDKNVSDGQPSGLPNGSPGGLTPELEDFLSAREPPLVFTLGSAAVMDAGDFFAESVRAARQLGRRAVLLIGRDPRNRPQAALPDSILAAEYAPYSQLFPRAAALVHQGGVGTTGQALRAGRPMLVMPYSHDQPDNAARVERMGVARVIARKRYNAARAAAELNLLLEDSRYAEKAREAGRIVQAENGVKTACDALEELLNAPPPGLASLGNRGPFRASARP